MLLVHFFPYLLLLCCVHNVPVTTLIISDIGEDFHLCLEGMHPCRSLEYIANTSNISNTVIRINSTNYTLHGVAQFTGVDNITITGQDQSTTIITCSSVTNTTRGAGLAFENASLITLEHITITNCSIQIHDYNLIHLTSTATSILFSASKYIKINSIRVSGSTGQGLTMLNTVLNVSICNSLFTNNGLLKSHGGGGLHILTLEEQLYDMYNCCIVIRNNTFTNNTAISKIGLHLVRAQHSDRGGGARILIFGEVCSQVQVDFSNNTVTGNTAVFGGGLFISMNSRSVDNNSIFINKTSFSRNQALKTGGGACVGYSVFDYESDFPKHNKIIFQDALFTRNNATYGGGLSIYTERLSFRNQEPDNTIICDTCYFVKNTACGGAAVNVGQHSPDKDGRLFLSSILFNSSQFIGNEVITDQRHFYQGSGTMYTADITIELFGHIIFRNNKNTALCAESAYVIIRNSSIVEFVNNSGAKGGAILLLGDSNVYTYDNSMLYFQNNSAIYGGAIYSLQQMQRRFSFMETCFLQSQLYNVSVSSNITFFFINNSATHLGNNIFANSFAACINFCEERVQENLNLLHLFSNSCIGAFHYGNSPDSMHKDLASLPTRITTKWNSTLYITPGIEFDLGIKLYDEVNNEVERYFELTPKLQNTEPNVFIDQHYLVVTQYSKMKLLGKPNQTGELVLETLITPCVQNILDFKFTECEAGYILNNQSCLCNHKINLLCVNNTPQLSVGQWVGYIDSKLYGGMCISELCSNTKIEDKLTPLPSRSELLQGVTCGNNRTGILCGKCTGNYSVYYHSSDYTCGDSSHCSYGILFYILTELLPVTILFLVILVFNVSLTSGALYSFVFYAQTVSTLDITSFGLVQTKYEGIFINILQIFYGIFNLDLLNTESLAFCLMPTKSIMNLLMFKYATALYAFLLVIGTILILRIHSCFCCVIMCSRHCGRSNIRGSIVDGLSTFLVLCYAQCALTTTKILMQSAVTHNDSDIKHYPIFDGELEYLHGQHLAYVVPAFLCIVLILLPPPVILILEPFLTKLFSLKHIRKTTIRLLYDRLRLKLMPFLDSFQACFQDKHRYFAGLYFVYRLIISSLFFASTDIADCFGKAIFLLFGMLFLHSLVLPYKKKWHSLLELYLLINLVMMYCVSTLRFYSVQFRFNKKYFTNKTVTLIQLFLLFPPFMFVCYYTTIQFCKKILIKMKCCSKPQNEQESTLQQNDFGFPARLLISESYNTFEQ